MTKKLLISTFSRCFFGKETMATNAMNTKKNNRSGWKQLSLMVLFVGMMGGSGWAQQYIMSANFTPATATVGNTNTVVTGVTSTYYTLSTGFGMIGGTWKSGVGAGAGTANNTCFSAYTAGTGYAIGTVGTSSTAGQAAAGSGATIASSGVGFIDFVFTNRAASESFNIQVFQVL